MLSNRERFIVKELLKSQPNFVSTQYLSECCDKSVRTIQSDLQNLKEVLHKNRAILHISHRDGYCLEIVDKSLFDTFCHDFIYNFSNSIETKNDRTLYILSRLIKEDDFIKIDQLADDLYLSKSTINYSIKDLKDILKKYDLTLEHKPYYGIHILGDEASKRKCFINEIITVENLNKDDQDNLFEKVSDIVSSCFVKMKYKIDDVSIMNLLMHIYVNVKRIIKGKHIQFTSNQEFLSIFSHEIEMATEIYSSLANVLNFEVSEDEINSLAVQIKGKRNYDSEDVITEEANNTIMEILMYIDKKLNIDLSYDVELRVALALHFLPLKIRLDNDMQLRNPLAYDIKRNFTFAYELATVAGIFLHEKYGYNLNENELSYLAVHFNLSLEKQTLRSKGKRVVVLCSSRTSDSLLLKYTLKKWFNELVLDIDVLNLYELDVNELNSYDVVFTTVDNDPRVPLNAIKINYFLNENDYIKMKKVLMFNEKDVFLNFFEEDLFLKDVKCENKESLIKKMTDLALKHKKVEPHLYESVIQREQYGFTSFGNLIAVPHPNDLISDETFVVSAILKEPISWGEQMAQLVFLVCVERENNVELKNLFGIMSRLLSDAEMIKEIINQNDFNYMMECFKKLV